MASSDTGILTTSTAAPLRPGRPAWVAAGLLLVAVAVLGLVWRGDGGRAVLAAAGAGGLLRGALLARAAGIGLLDERARPFGLVLGAAGLAGVVVAALSAAVTGAVLVVGVPLFLLLASGGLIARPGAMRRGGQVLLAWAVLVAGFLAGLGATQGWDRAVGLATVVGALTLAAAGVVVAVGGGTCRAPVAAPAPAPAGCGGCACGAGGCGGLGG